MDATEDTRLARQLIEAAAEAMAILDRAPLTERVLKAYREDAKVIAAAVIARLAELGGISGLFPRGGLEAHALAILAEELGEG